MKLIVVGALLLLGCASTESGTAIESDSLTTKAPESFGALESASSNVIHVTVDATALSATEAQSIRTLSVRVLGDSKLVAAHTYPITSELADGNQRVAFPYYPGIDQGVLAFRIGVNDVDGVELTAAERKFPVNNGKGTCGARVIELAVGKSPAK